ncbi:hypothetical protein MTO96_003912 [Rhipicephalus appendiculatus]
MEVNGHTRYDVTTDTGHLKGGCSSESMDLDGTIVKRNARENGRVSSSHLPDRLRHRGATAVHVVGFEQEERRPGNGSQGASPLDEPANRSRRLPSCCAFPRGDVGVSRSRSAPSPVVRSD